MSARASAQLAWSVWVLAVSLTFAALAFLILNRSTPGASTFGSHVTDAFFGLALLAFPSVGALVASRRPGNPIGWILVGLGAMFAIAAFTSEYATYALLTEPEALPGGEAMAWLSSWLFLAPLILTGTLLFLLFPEGRLLSPRWRPVLLLALGGIALSVFAEMFGPHELQDFEPMKNPYAVGGAGAEAAFGWAANIGFVLMFCTLLASVASILLQFRRARGIERQQLKWVASAAGLMGIAWVSGPALFWWIGDGDGPWEAVVVLAITAIPIAAGVAILRYRLYEIDQIVNRAVVYGALSALLAGLYFGIVLALQEVFSGFAGGSDLAIAVSTLAVAALFRPVRSRIQAFVDRRFYRRRYDAQQTLEAFSSRLRDEVDLDALAGELRGVVQETMQPAHVTLWLRPTGVER
jgi:hypothetical protein